MTTGIRILIVEDEDLVRTLLSEALQAQGFIVSGAASADDALSQLDDDGIDLLMTDIQLLGARDGLDLARTVRSRRPDLPIIFTTGQPERMVAWPVGVSDIFIAKPYRPSEVCAAARMLTRR